MMCDRTTLIEVACSENLSYQPLYTFAHLKTAIASYQRFNIFSRLLYDINAFGCSDLLSW